MQILAERNASANALGQEDMGLKEREEGLWLQHQGKCKMSKAGSSRSLDCVLNAVGSHRLWVAVQQRKGCDCWVENGL